MEDAVILTAVLLRRHEDSVALCCRDVQSGGCGLFGINAIHLYDRHVVLFKADKVRWKGTNVYNAEQVGVSG